MNGEYLIETIFSGFLVGFLGMLLLFLICRAIVLWYFKINKRMAEQEKTNALLEKILIALLQGNISGYETVNQVTNNSGHDTGKTPGSSVMPSESDIPEL